MEEIDLPTDGGRLSAMWKSITGWGIGQYEVSDSGEVRSLARMKSGMGEYPVPERILKAQVVAGYPLVRLYAEDGKGVWKSRSVHRLVAQAFCSGAENGRHVKHKNGVKTDNRAENLEWESRSDKNLHSFDLLGRQIKRGEDHSLAKLTEEQVLEIRRLRASGVSGEDLAKEFKVRKGTVSDVVRRVTWRHVA